MAVIDPDNNQVDNAVAEGGAYEIIRRRLLEQGTTLKQFTSQLNESRLQEFGSSEMAVLARIRVRTENNCTPRDIVQVGDTLLFGYNVFIGLKTETKVEDVFALFALRHEGELVDIEEKPVAGTFLDDANFVSDFEELYRYYKHTHLTQLTIRDGKLLAGFQIGERIEDTRVFRWSISGDGKSVQYIDNRGERDIQLPPAYDFEWTKTEREHVVHGKHPHVNINNQLFVETVGGDLTIKVENNTESGLGIYSEPVEDSTQSIDDADYYFAELGSLILLKIRPYRESDWRYFIYNKLTQGVLRVDSIGASCVQLPEDHGLVFPGGYYLQSGQYKTFDDEARQMRFKRAIRSPNGEDVLYVFYEPVDGVVGLFAYNMIKKTLQNPIYGDGYALADDGTLVIFVATEEPTRVHPMQVWKTPFYSDEFASSEPPTQNFYGRVGNAELVRGISDLFGVVRIIDNQSVTARLYEELRRTAGKLFDDHYWLNEPETEGIKAVAQSIMDTAELAIDEFEKVESIRRQSQKALQQAETEQKSLVTRIRTSNWTAVEDFIQALDSIRRQRGHLATIKEHRYIHLERIEALEREIIDVQEQLSGRTVRFLAEDNALKPYDEKLAAFHQELDRVKSVADLKPIMNSVEEAAAGLDLLSDLLATLQIEDATLRTRIIDNISEVYGRLNQLKAKAKHKQKSLGSKEAVAQFSAQFKLFSQSITNALGSADTPESCDEQMARLLAQLEDLESQFADYDEFLVDIVAKREEVYEGFEAHKQRLLDGRQRRAQSVADAAERILNSIDRRSLKFSSADELNTYYASDALVLKIRQLVDQLRELDASVKADDMESRFKAIKDQSLRALRDRSDLYEGDGKVVKLGPRHRFSVNTQELDLTIIPRQESLFFHLIGTDYYQPLGDHELNNLQDFWFVSLESENEHVYRSEYLAYSIIEQAKQDTDYANELQRALLDEDALKQLVRNYAAPKYKEGYEKGIHDHDAVLLLEQIVPLLAQADLLQYDPLVRGFAQVFWANLQTLGNRLDLPRLSYETWEERAKSAVQMKSVFGASDAQNLLAEEIVVAMGVFLAKHPLPVTELVKRRAADYLVQELGRERCEFITSKYARQLAETLRQSLNDQTWRRYQVSLEKMLGWPAERWSISCAWLDALVKDKQLDHLQRYIPEAAALINSDQRLDRRVTEVDLDFQITGLMGEHPLIKDRSLRLSLDVFLQKLELHQREFIPTYRRYLAMRQSLLDSKRKALRLHEFRPQPLSSFVRNKLINDAYLPIIGDNLAKQMGTVGDSKRSDLMGLLMMISPPGYGKTTLMEYVASRLGLIFMKINCPSLGHDVLSLDPSKAPNATAAQELQKLNLGLEMGNNVMLYLDDIQHTHPEFLQKFISLCDGTRRIEGVWQEQSKTYDMRGKKFCVVMAGNPYTESGEMFKVPDMLANRADIYNLGDILGGMDEQFALSYIENALTSNAVLAPLATRDVQDVYRFIRLAQGENVATTDFSHQYSAAEVSEIVSVLKKLFMIRDVVLKVNKLYIQSAAQADKYRTEPPFKLQGSYRNMNKMAEKVSAVMDDSELNQMIDDHYLGEAQLLTSGAEENLLKLGSVRGTLDDQTKQRWRQICEDYLRNKALGGDDTDTGNKVVMQIHDLVKAVQGVGMHLAQKAVSPEDKPIESQHELTAAVRQLRKTLTTVREPKVEVINQPVPGLDELLRTLTESIQNSLFPIVRSMDKKLEIDLRTHYTMKSVSKQLADIEIEIQRQLQNERNQLHGDTENGNG